MQSDKDNNGNKVIFEIEIKVGQIVDKIIVKKNDIVTNVISDFV